MGYRDGQKLAIRGLKFSSQCEKGRVIHSWDQALPELNYHSYIITIPHRLFIIYFSQFPLTIIHGESRHALCRGTESRQCDPYRLDFTEQRLEVKPKCDRVEKKRKKKERNKERKKSHLMAISLRVYRAGLFKARLS